MFHVERSPLERVEFKAGLRFRVVGSEEWKEVRSSQLQPTGLVEIVASDGKTFLETDVCEIEKEEDFFSKYSGDQLSKPGHFFLRIDVLNLLEERRDFQFPGAIGCRVEALPHQFSVLKSLKEDDPARALLADEVGLGKTIEAGLVFSYLHATQKLKKVLVVCPEALKVQWLTECYRRFNVKFRLDHEEMIDGEDHRDFVISSPEALSGNLSAQDLLIVDEAHRIFADVDLAKVVKGLCSVSKHVLFLSATPLSSGPKVFEKMVEALEDGAGRHKVFQSVRDEIEWSARRELQVEFVENRYAWLRGWLKQQGKKKTFLICESAEEATQLHGKLKKDLGENFALFHEGMDLVARDRQAAYFSEPMGAHCLVSSEIGGEGRNFQFCQDLIMWDLPLDPLLIEQRIGRLDRIGQKQTVNIWCPVVEGSQDEHSLEVLKDSFEVFTKPWTGAGISEMSLDELLASRKGVGGELRNRIANIREEIPANVVDELSREFEDFEGIEIKETLLEVYDAFGVEVTDVNDNQDATIAASSLMFVDYFPGVGSDGEKLITFERSRALAQEDKMFYSLDHPDVLEGFDFFLKSSLGKLSVCEVIRGLSSDIILQAMLVDDEGAAFFEAWSCVKSELSEQIWSTPDDLKECDASVLAPALVQKLRQSYTQFSQAIESNHQGCRVDALLVLLPS